LIHPARVIRLNERVDENGAKVAEALVEMIVEEVSNQRRKTYGYTASQIIDKMIKDSSVQPILGSILKQTNKFEIERLLLLLPKKYLEVISDPNQSEDIGYYLRSFDECFRLAFEKTSDEVRVVIASRYATVIREGSEQEIQSYGDHFFIASDMQYLSEEDKDLVKKYILHTLSSNLYRGAKFLTGLGSFLEANEVSSFVDPVIRMLTSKGEVDVEGIIEAEYHNMPSETQEAVMTRLNIWINTFDRRNAITASSQVRGIRERLALDEDLPF
jgi:hypothetical protein